MLSDPYPLSEARDQTCNLVDTSRVLNLLSHTGNSLELVILVKSEMAHLGLAARYFLGNHHSSEENVRVETNKQLLHDLEAAE